MIPEIDIWRVANLMLQRYGDLAEEESARRADELPRGRGCCGRGGLASGHGCSQATREHDTARAGTLTAPRINCFQLLGLGLMS
jgi:hypothetical protein